MAKAEPRHETLRWAIAFVLALGAHLAVLTPLMAHRHTASDKEVANAVLVDLAADVETTQAVLSDDKLPRDTQFSQPSEMKLAAPPDVEPLEETLTREAGAEPQREAKAEPLHQDEPLPDIEPIRQENPPAVLPERVEPTKPKHEPTKPKVEIKKAKPVEKPKVEAKKEKPVAKPKTEPPVRTAKL